MNLVLLDDSNSNQTPVSTKRLLRHQLDLDVESARRVILGVMSVRARRAGSTHQPPTMAG